MNISKKFVNFVSAAALMVGMTSGIASAATDTDSADTNLNVTCPATATVDVEVYGNFAVDMTAYQPFFDAHLPGGFEVTMDLTCNWSTDFQVSAEIGTFNHQNPGSIAPGTLPAFGGEHLLLDNGSLTSYSGPDIPFIAEAPNVEGTVFEFIQTYDPDVIENGYDVFFWWLVPVASPGITVATWDGHLYLLPPNLAEGTYTAPLTVELTVN